MFRQDRKSGRNNELLGLQGSEERNLELETKTPGRPQALRMLQNKAESGHMTDKI